MSTTLQNWTSNVRHCDVAEVPTTDEGAAAKIDLFDQLIGGGLSKRRPDATGPIAVV
jgi:hypothetical protein